MRCVVFYFFIEIVSSSSQWIRFESKYFQINNEQTTRSMAIQACQQRGAVLTSISNQREWDFLIRSVNQTQAYWVWVSRKNGIFQWEDGQNCCPYGWWTTKIPPKDTDTCAKLFRYKYNFRLYGTHCEQVYGFICSKPFSFSSEWVRFESKCFQINTQKMNRSKAIQTCQQRGSILTSISNKNEWNFLTRHLSWTQAYWMRTSSKNGTFQWEDGQNCCPNSSCTLSMPSNDNETCARVNKLRHYFQLYGKNCEETYGFICSKPSNAWELVSSNDYNLSELCGVEIMPNCKGLLCETACLSHHDCNHFAKISNLCVNVKNVSETDNCIIRLTTNMELYSLKDYC